MKKIIDKIMLNSLTRLFDILLNALEGWLNADLDGDGKIAGKEVKDAEEVQS